jgi:fibronectin-binding autotransporter adhesin
MLLRSKTLPRRTLAMGRLFGPLTGSIALLCAAAQGAEISKLQNNTALNLPGAWNGGAVPGPGDIMLWDSLFTTPGAIATMSNLGGDLSVQGLKVTNVGGALNAGTTQVGFQNGASTNTLTIGANGIDCSAATQTLTITSKVLLGADQSWTVINANTNGNPATLNNGEDLAFIAGVANASFNLGGRVVGVSGTGQISISSGYAITNGTINIANNLFLIQGGGSRVTSVGADVNLNVASGSILHFQGNSQAVTSSANITLNGGTLKMMTGAAAGAVTIGGTINVASASTLLRGNNFANGGGVTNPVTVSGNLLGAGALAVTNSSGAVGLIVLSGDNSGYSGTLTLGGTAGRVTQLNSATTGSAAATWNVTTGHTLALNGVNVSLGTLTGGGTVNTSLAGTSIASIGGGNFTGALVNGTGVLALTKTGAGTLSLSGANTYTGATQVNGGTLLTTPAQTGATAITVADGATFGVNLVTAGTTFNTPSLTVGSATGGSVQFGGGSLGNPTVPLINATVFDPVAGTTFKLTGTALSVANNIPLLSYSGAIGGGGFAGLGLSLPARTLGGLVDNSANSRVDLNITSIEQVKWKGNVDGNWDADIDGTGTTGTQNWLTTTSLTPTKYLQGSGGIDAVNFDDSATGTSTIDLTTTLTPVGTTVNNNLAGVPVYTFQGPGKLSGTGALTKQGNGTLVLANTVAYDHSGGTTIGGGTLQIGDGATNGVGILPGGAITNSATMVFNRPDNYVVSQSIGGTGTIIKNNANDLTFNAAATNAHNYQINGGRLLFSSGGNLSGVISGTGLLENTAGTLQLSGTGANTNTAVTTISGGRIELNKSPGVNAVGGDITVTGGGTFTILQANQIPDTATLTFLGTSADAVPGTPGNETVANVIVNTSNGITGQFIMRSAFTVTNTGTVLSGILGVASGNEATVNSIVMGPGSIVRIAGGSAASTLHVGSGGITASGGDIQVKFSATDFAATVNLGGNFTATGNVTFSNANYAGASVNVVNLTGSRIFDIATGTTTTVAPDFGGTGSLTKSGNGTLTLNLSSTAAHGGGTTVSAGTLRVNGAVSGAVSVNGATAVLTGTGTVGALNVLNDGTVAPGNNAGLFTTGSLSMSLGTTLAIEVDSTVPATGYDQLAVNGTVSLGNATLAMSGAYLTTPNITNDLFFVLLNDDVDAITGTFDGLADGATVIAPNGQEYLISYFGDSTTSAFIGGNDVVLQAVPEPAGVALLLGGLGLLAGRRQRRRP